MNELAILEGLKELYGEKAENVKKQVDILSDKYRFSLPHYEKQLSEKDAVLITYADTIWREGQFPLETLDEFLNQNIGNLVNSIHVLPFSPSSSDDGFAVTDYYSVNPEFGTWEHIEQLSAKYYLMFDAVINHVSKNSDWFKDFLDGKSGFEKFFIEVDDTDDRIKQVFRPRALPLVHKYSSTSGVLKSVWTTFSEDQVDLNYTDEKVFVAILELLLFYISKGARLIRLDAVGFLWKRLGTTCIHLPETHLVIRLYRKIIESLTSGVIFITETNVPHKDNISYFGNGNNEAHMVYNFTLPPLLAFSIITSNVQKLGKWLSGLNFPSGGACYFNFTASHDGIGLQPVKDILTKEEIGRLEYQATVNNGFVSYKNDSDGTRSAYELNCSYLNFVSSPQDTSKQKSQKFMLTQAFMLTLPGIPGIYIHSLLGTQNDLTAVEKSGIKRRINRSKSEYNVLLEALHEEGSLQNLVFSEYKKLLQVRRAYNWFAPSLEIEIKTISDQVIVIQKKQGKRSFWAVFNFSEKAYNFELFQNQKVKNLMTGVDLYSEKISLEPYAFRWYESV